MKANEFIKKFGLSHTTYLLKDTELTEFAIHSNCAGKHYMDTVCVSDLKRLVESWELVEKHGLEQSKEIVKNAPSDDVYYSWTLGNSGVKDKTVHVGTLRKAILDVESCK